MTYLQLINGVLTRLREDTITGLVGTTDTVALLVAEFVNDAKETVEQSHDWNALRFTWTFNTSVGTDTYALTGSQQGDNIELVSNDTTNVLLKQTTPYAIRRKGIISSSNAEPSLFAINGVDGSGDTQIKLHPTPDQSYSIIVDGYKKQAALSADADTLLVPSKPVIYMALAMAARERGEVGGQTAAELFRLAGQYLSDAIAIDASRSPLENVFFVS